MSRLPTPLTIVLLLVLFTLSHIPTSHAVIVKNNPINALSASVLAASSHHDIKSSRAVQRIYEIPALHTAFRRGFGSGAVRQADTSSGGGGTLAVCDTSSDCMTDRVCASFNTDTVLVDGTVELCDQATATSPCRCLPREAREFFCSCRDSCLTGDTCILSSDGSRGICVALGSTSTPFPCGPNSGGFTLEICSSNEGCADGRVCTNASPNPDCSLEICQCVPMDADRSCDCEDPSCLTGDFCGIVEGSEESTCLSQAFINDPLQCDSLSSTPPVPSPGSTSETTQPPSTSTTDDNPTVEATSQPNPAASPASPSGIDTLPVPAGTSTPSDTPTPPPTTPPPTEDVCVDARMLSGFEPNELVYEKHPVSRVLCDRSGSCATPGHIVHYKGSAMMMKSYCEMVGCEKALMEVNSPKYRRGVRVGSKTDGLHFTAFAARYGTKAEEGLMAAAVRMGL